MLCCGAVSDGHPHPLAGENSLHWVLDVAFQEDDCRDRTDYTRENFTLLRHLTLNALNQEKTAKLDIKNKPLRAGWNNEYLLQMLAGG